MSNLGMPDTSKTDEFIDDTLVMNFGEILQYDFPKMRGGGNQSLFGTFPKIHPSWRCGASLRTKIKLYLAQLRTSSLVRLYLRRKS